MTNLSGRSAIVTGGFSGMGFAIATALAQAGANVAVGSYIAPAGADKSDAAYYPGADEIERVRFGPVGPWHQGSRRSSRCPR